MVRQKIKGYVAMSAEVESRDDGSKAHCRNSSKFQECRPAFSFTQSCSCGQQAALNKESCEDAKTHGMMQAMTSCISDKNSQSIRAYLPSSHPPPPSESELIEALRGQRKNGICGGSKCFSMACFSQESKSSFSIANTTHQDTAHSYVASSLIRTIMKAEEAKRVLRAEHQSSLAAIAAIALIAKDPLSLSAPAVFPFAPSPRLQNPSAWHFSNDLGY